MRTSTKRKIFESSTLPALTYGTQTWATTETHNLKLVRTQIAMEHSNRTMSQVYVDVASARLRHAVWCCAPKNLIVKLLVPSKEAAQHMMSKGFQNGISQFEKKIRQSSQVSFHSFCNLKKVCKKFFFHVDAITSAAYAERLLPHAKLQCIAFCHGA